MCVATFSTAYANVSFFTPDAREGAALPDHIYMDAMGFGMGCCCLQITFQACSVSEARRMYDAFVPVGPIMVRCLYFRRGEASN